MLAIPEPPKLWAYVSGIAKNLRYQPYAAGGTGNHIHVLAGIPATVSASEAVQKLKLTPRDGYVNTANGQDGRRATELSR